MHLIKLYCTAHAREEPPAPSPPSAFPSPSFFSALASLLLAAAFPSPAAASAFPSAGGFGFALASAPAALALASPAGGFCAAAGCCYCYVDALIASCMALSSSSMPCSKRKFAAISSFLSQAKKASAARAFEKPS